MYKIKYLIFLLFSLLMHTTASAVEYPVPNCPYDITTSDIDCDGDIDVIVGSNISSSVNDSISIFYNDGMGNFTPYYMEKENFHFLKCITIDNDNFPDLLTKNIENYSFVYYKNNGDGTFEDGTVIHTTLSDHNEYIEISDTNNNGDNDIVFYERSPDSYWGILYNNGYGDFTENVYFITDANLMDIDVGKLNEDNLPDVVMNTTDSTLPRIFYNYITYFTEYTLNTRLWTHNFITDINNDGLNDIMYFGHCYFVGRNCKYCVAYNEGNYEFTFGDTLEFPCGTLIRDVADYNNDGYDDVAYVVAIWDSPDDNSIHTCFNNHDGTFSEPVSYYMGIPSIFRVCSADFDNNGYLDLAITGYSLGGGHHRLGILFNDGTGNFTDEPQFCIDEENVLFQSINNYPNPFHNTTTISFSVREQNARNARVMIYNLKGQCVCELKIEDIIGNTNTVVWNGKDNYHNQVSSGVYLYRLQSDDFVSETKKLILMK